MSVPTVFLSAASVDLREWRDVLDGAFRRAGFRVLTQDKSLSSAPGNVKRLLTETIAESDYIIHLAGLGYGSDATDPFPEEPDFHCSWTQFEYYLGHQQKKDVIAFVCAPALSKPGFAETGADAADIARKQRLQRAHRLRVERGTFENTPLPNTPEGRTSNETINSIADLLTAVAAAVGTLHKLDRNICENAQHQLRDLAEGVGSANYKLDEIMALLRPAAAAPPFQLPLAASQYFGRAALVADLTARLRRQKRTEVWGGPGMGKTALAAEAVASIVGVDPASLPASPFPHGVVFLDLYLHKGSLDNAWNALANAFDDSLPTDMPADARAAKACARRRALIIVEGAEELGSKLDDFTAVLAPESTLLVLTRDEKQTAAAHRIRLDDLLQANDALALLRHLAGAAVPQTILGAVQARLGGHPLALTWAGSQLGDSTQPPANFLRDLEAETFAKLTEPGGNPEHTLRWMFDRSVRLMGNPTSTVLAAAARISEPFDVDLAEIAGGKEDDLQRLVQLSFLLASVEGWQFAHALAAQYARELQMPNGLLQKLGRWVIDAIAFADVRCQTEGTTPLGLAVAHATALLAHDTAERALGSVASALTYHHEGDTVGIRRGRIDIARRAVDAVRQWHEHAAEEERSTPSCQRELSVSLNRLGDLAVAQGDLAAALRYFTQSKTIAERLVASDPTNAAWQHDLSVSLNKFGDLAVAQGDLVAALRYCTESKTIHESLAAIDPANAEWQHAFSVALGRLGDLAVAQGDPVAALRYFTQSKTICESLAAIDPANAAWQRYLSVTLNKLGDLALGQGDLVAALRYFNQCKTMRERFAAIDPADTEWQRALSVSLIKLGDLAVAQRDLTAASPYFIQSKAIFERLAASDPANAAWQHDLSVSLLKLGDLAVAQDELAAALGYFTQCKTILESLAANDPANAAWQRDLSVSLIKLGDLAVAQRDLTAASLYFTQSKAIIERLAASDPANAAWQRDLAVSHFKLYQFAGKSGYKAMMETELRATFDVLEGMKSRGMHMDTPSAQLHAQLYRRFGSVRKSVYEGRSSVKGDRDGRQERGSKEAGSRRSRVFFWDP